MHIFTYGSLMFPEIWTRVVRGSYRSRPALLAHHVRYAVRGETYPGMVRQADGWVDGILYLDVDAADIAALDVFEGADYSRAMVQVSCASGENLQAAAYLYLLPQRLSESPWLPESFQMARFIGTYCPTRPLGRPAEPV